MGVSYRQARRIRQKWRNGGPSALIHGSRGRVSNRRRPDKEREAVLARYRKRYGNFGPTLAVERLTEEGLPVARETLHRRLTGAQFRPGRPHISGRPSPSSSITRQTVLRLTSTPSRLRSAQIRR